MADDNKEDYPLPPNVEFNQMPDKNVRLRDMSGPVQAAKQRSAKKAFFAKAFTGV